MYCQRCGAQNPDGSIKCFSCGSELAPVSVAAGVAARTSRLAVAALILGVLAFFTCGITALPALICGIIAMVKISGSRGLLKGTGMAITGIVLPALLILMIPVLAAILLPALTRARDIAQRTVCGTNLRGLSAAIMIYATDYNGKMPTPDRWCDLLVQQAGVSENSFHCPGAPEGTCSYAVNSNLERLSGQEAPRLVAVFESRPGWNQAGGPELLTTEYHEGDGCNVGFADGHVEFVRAENLSNLMWTTDQ